MYIPNPKAHQVNMGSCIQKQQSWNSCLPGPDRRWPLPLPEALCSGGSVAQSCPTLVPPWTVAHQAPLSMGFHRQEYWAGLPFPSPLTSYNLLENWEKHKWRRQQTVGICSLCLSHRVSCKDQLREAAVIYIKCHMLKKLHLSLPFWLLEKVLFQPDLKVRSGVEEWDRKDQNTAQRVAKEGKPRAAGFSLAVSFKVKSQRQQACDGLTEISPQRRIWCHVFQI